MLVRGSCIGLSAVAALPALCMGLKSDSLMQVNHRLHRHHHLLHHDHHHDHHDHHRLFGEPSFQDKRVESFVSREVKFYADISNLTGFSFPKMNLDFCTSDSAVRWPAVPLRQVCIPGSQDGWGVLYAGLLLAAHHLLISTFQLGSCHLIGPNF